MARFEDSAEATDFMEQLSSMLNDPRLKDWATVTEENYGGDFIAQLRMAKIAYKEFLDAMYEAE
jgi:hypothetical protein